MCTRAARQKDMNTTFHSIISVLEVLQVCLYQIQWFVKAVTVYADFNILSRVLVRQQKWFKRKASAHLRDSFSAATTV